MYQTGVHTIRELFNLDWISSIGSFIYNKSKNPTTNKIHIIMFNTQELIDFWRYEYKPNYYNFLKELINECNIYIE